MFPHQNPLPKPDIITTPKFEDLLQTVKSKVLEYLAENAPDDVANVEETFANEAELLTKFTEAFTVILQSYFRQMNEQALQMFGMYATDDGMVDLIASQLGVERQILEEGDPDAFPVVPAVMESNEDLLTRYYLAAYALATTGTRSGYRFNAMTLGGRPKVTVESPTNKKVVVTYEFESHELAGQTKDAQARQISPGVVDCFILSHGNNGMPTEELIAATKSYMTRDDIAQETDLLDVKAPTLKAWSCHAELYVQSGSDVVTAKSAAEEAVQNYAEQQHRLGGRIEPSMLYSVLLKNTGANRCDLIAPSEALRCEFNEAPYIDSIQITVRNANL
ncbi:baseplate J/gp47 family protein [Marinomonas transparens]|uniref:Baseplate J/gp47 family protein n=1 Tax=Marinomonas transparens TaxID=2795388 RepID=A0A934JIH2_9GAMM|nr:baseplate J/gp47 family protein [Marinomonas transparens]MBJ7536640.1 baseplate J/gp47 family protein [Marinomonas transparens]